MGEQISEVIHKSSCPSGAVVNVKTAQGVRRVTFRKFCKEEKMAMQWRILNKAQMILSACIAARAH